MKSVQFYEAEDRKNPQTNVIISEKEIFEKLRSICEEKWGGYRDWTFDRWWREYWEDLWLYIKQDPDEVLLQTKIVTCTMWFEKNQSEQKIYEDMATLVDGFLEKWKKEHPEPEPVEEELLDEDSVFTSLVKRIF